MKTNVRSMHKAQVDLASTYNDSHGVHKHLCQVGPSS